MTDELNLEGGIALVGMACRLPQASNLSAFWELLAAGREPLSHWSDEELLADGADPAELSLPNYVKSGFALEEPDLFDASFFGLNPREAQVMDPQHRLFLECAWATFEDAAIVPTSFAGPIGVYAGAALSTYLLHNVYPQRRRLRPMDDLQILLLNDKDFLPTRLSYLLNLKGPSVNVQTACSTSLVAVHMACQGLLNGECDLALAGGVSVRVPQRTGYLYRENMISSRDGHCRPFDAEASGTLLGHGAGAVLLRPLADALEAGDHIYAVIRGTAINNDGALKVSFSAPSIEGQTAVISEALAIAEVEPETVSYVEAHGTATELGDPIEMEALSQAFANTPQGSCALGSVKGNLGHLNPAAGVVGLIKTALALHHEHLPPSLHYQAPNPKIDFENSPFFVNTELREWRRGAVPRRAGVSSFGMGGTNAHAVLEEAPTPPESDAGRSHQLLLLSARTEASLEQNSVELARFLGVRPEPPVWTPRTERNLRGEWERGEGGEGFPAVEHRPQKSIRAVPAELRETNPHLCLADVAHTLQVGRSQFPFRRAVVVSSAAEASKALESGEGCLDSWEEKVNRPVAFLFSGQGTQYPEMAAGLYAAEPVFRREVDQCAEILRPLLGRDLRTLLLTPEDPTQDDADVRAVALRQTALAQPALFTVELALARLWIHWLGGPPRAMLGHSLGELVAATVAGVFSREGALHLVATRGRLMQEMPAGSMLAVDLPAADLESRLTGGLALAAVNGPHRCVATGPTLEAGALERALGADGVVCRKLHTSHAFHSSMMEAAAEAFLPAVEKLELNPPEIPFLSNLSGDWIRKEEATSPRYWARQLRETVRFSAGLEKLLAEPEQILLEVGPGKSLTTLAGGHPDRSRQQPVFASLRTARDGQPDLAFLLTTLGKLWLAGASIDWQAFAADERRRRLPLPTYAFDRQSYWIDPPTPSADPLDPLPLAVPPAAPKARRFGKAFVAPRSPLEQEVADLWRSLLGVAEIGAEDDFFDLGGDSLTATQVAARLREDHGLALELAELFEHPTVEGLARVIETWRWARGDTTTEAATDDREEGSL